MTDLADMPRDPDWDVVPESLEVMACLDHGQVTVFSPDGVSRDTVVVVPGLFGHARRLEEPV